MSNAAFTPGPWSYRLEGQRHVIFIERPIGEAALAAIGMTAGTFHESVANAALIASAPNLYAAALEMREALDVGGPWDGAHAVRVSNALEGIRDALATAHPDRRQRGRVRRCR